MTTHEHDDTMPGDERDAAQAGRLLRGAMGAPAFRAGFTDRTMARIAAERAAGSVTVAPAPPSVQRAVVMQHHFRLLAAAAGLAIAALGVHNTIVARADGATIVEAAIGLQPVSATSVLAYSTDVTE